MNQTRLICSFLALLWLVPAALGPLFSDSRLALWSAVPIVFFLNSTNKIIRQYLVTKSFFMWNNIVNYRNCSCVF